MKLEFISEVPEGSPRKAPILFVHGAWHGAWCWQENFMPYFAAKGHPAYALSLRGHGGSDGPRHFRWMRIADYVEDVVQVMKGLPAETVLVGHSMGGLVVQKYLEEHTAPAAVLMASVPVKGALCTTLRIAWRHPLAFIKANLLWSLYPIIGTPELTGEAFFSRGISADRLTRFFDRMQDEAYLAFLDMVLFNLPDPAKISTELLVLGAREDTVFLPDEVEATAAAYNRLPEIFPEMAHDMMLEPGWRGVADRIVEWLEGKADGESTERAA